MTSSCDRSTLARRLLATALGMLFSGCSFVSVQRPRPPLAVEDPRVQDTCTTSSQTAIADTVLAGVGLIAGYAMMLNAMMEDLDCMETSTSSCDSGNPAPGLAVFGAGAVYAGSAIYGYVSAAQCRHRVVASARCQNGDLGACQKVKPGWAPPPEWRAGPTLAPRPVPAPPTAPPPTAPAAAASPPAAPPPSTSEWTHEPAQPGATVPAPSPR